MEGKIFWILSIQKNFFQIQNSKEKFVINAKIQDIQLLVD